MTVMCPGTYTEPGEVLCHGKPKRGIFDIGRYPSGSDETARRDRRGAGEGRVQDRRSSTT